MKFFKCLNWAMWFCVVLSLAMAVFASTPLLALVHVVQAALCALVAMMDPNCL